MQTIRNRVLRFARRLPYVVAALSLVACAAWALHIVHRTAPALEPALRIAGPTGEMRQGPSPVMFDYGAYLMQTGYDYLYADALSDMPLSAEAAERSRTRAASLFEAALRQDPANAHIWQGYAQSLLYVPGAMATVERALALSGQRAPNTPLLAAARLEATRAFRVWTADPEAAAAQVASDRAVLAKHAPHALERFERR